MKFYDKYATDLCLHWGVFCLENEGGNKYQVAAEAVNTEFLECLP